MTCPNCDGPLTIKQSSHAPDLAYCPECVQSWIVGGETA